MLEILALALTPPGVSPNGALAIQRAAEAAYIQTGASDFVRTTQNQATSYARREGDYLGVTKTVAFASGAYQVFHTRTLTFHLSNSSICTIQSEFLSVTFSF